MYLLHLITYSQRNVIVITYANSTLIKLLNAAFSFSFIEELISVLTVTAGLIVHFPAFNKAKLNN